MPPIWEAQPKFHGTNMSSPQRRPSLTQPGPLRPLSPASSGLPPLSQPQHVPPGGNTGRLAAGLSCPLGGWGLSILCLFCSRTCLSPSGHVPHERTACLEPGLHQSKYPSCSTGGERRAPGKDPGSGQGGIKTEVTQNRQSHVLEKQPLLRPQLPTHTSRPFCASSIPSSGRG